MQKRSACKIPVCGFLWKRSRSFPVTSICEISFWSQDLFFFTEHSTRGNCPSWQNRFPSRHEGGRSVRLADAGFHKSVSLGIKSAGILQKDIHGSGGNILEHDLAGKGLLRDHGVCFSRILEGNPCFRCPDAFLEEKMSTMCGISCPFCHLVFLYFSTKNLYPVYIRIHGISRNYSIETERFFSLACFVYGFYSRYGNADGCLIK